jgi:mRNA interferase HicA
VKKRDLEKRLSKFGWWFDRHGGNHDVWTNGSIFESVPRHAEVNEMLAKKILRRAENNPPIEEEKR